MFQPVIGVRPPTEARLFCITGPVGPYYEQKGTEAAGNQGALAKYPSTNHEAEIRQKSL